MEIMNKELTITQPSPPIIISMRPKDAAAAIGVSLTYLNDAIRKGRLVATRKKPPGKGKGIVIITVKELERFANTNEGTEEGGKDA